MEQEDDPLSVKVARLSTEANQQLTQSGRVVVEAGGERRAEDSPRLPAHLARLLATHL